MWISKLIFISSKLMNPSYRENARIPLTFISFAITDGQLYDFRHDVVIVKGKRDHGNSVVYGAIYLLHDDMFHIRTLDALHNCSLDALGRNHKFDMSHRIEATVNPILFNTLEELDRLIYTEKEEMTMDMYVANLNNPKITKRTHIKKGVNYRISNGMDVNSFVEQFRRTKFGEAKQQSISGRL